MVTTPSICDRSPAISLHIWDTQQRKHRISEKGLIGRRTQKSNVQAFQDCTHLFSFIQNSRHEYEYKQGHHTTDKRNCFRP